ncbi:hypothetical protein AB6A40_009638 [Gnathostoma spinigerum]|uniref:Uncharacterized protein n=1 Tax=Gnathostoma spinigerum TaxID=75299 RepID=A0ABD6EXP8_9BILA
MTSPYYLRKKSQNRLLHRTDELIPLGGKDGVASKGMRTPRLLTTNRLKSSTKLKHDSLGQRSERLFLGRQVEYDRTNAVKEKERSERCIRIVGDGDRSLSYHLSSELDSSDESEPSETSVMSRSRWNDFSFPGSEDMLLIKDMRTSGAEGETKANSSQLDDEWEKSESSLPESSSQEEIYVTTIAERAKKSHRKKTEPIIPHKEQRRSKSSKSRKSRSCEFGKKSDAERKSERLTPVADFDKVFLLDLAENTSVFDAEYDPDLLDYLRKKFLKEISVKRKISYSSTRAKDTDIPDKNLSNKRSSTKPRSGKRKSSSHVSKRKKALHSDDVTAQSEGISWERDLRKRGLIAKKKTNLPKSTNSEELNTSKTGGIPQNPDVKPVLACIPGPVLDQNVANTERKERQLEETVSDLVKKSKVGNSDAVSTGITLPSSGKELDSTLRQLLNPDDPRAVRSTRYDGHDRGILENVDDEFCKALIQGEKEQNSIDSGIKLTVISDQSGASDSLGEANVSQTGDLFDKEHHM